MQRVTTHRRHSTASVGAATLATASQLVIARQYSLLVMLTVPSRAGKVHTVLEKSLKVLEFCF